LEFKSPWLGAVPWEAHDVILALITDNIENLEFSLVRPRLRNGKYSINIYGPENEVDNLKIELRKIRASFPDHDSRKTYTFLEDPYYIRPGVRYVNPQLLLFDENLSEDSIEENGTEIATWTASEVISRGFELRL
jgi:hypothetical protein